MKRRRNIESEIIFLIIPSEILDKIQSLLTIVSFIHLGETCKSLYEIQKSHMERKEEAIFAKFIKRIHSHLEFLGLLNLVEQFLPQFSSVIGGDLVSEYLFSPDVLFSPNFLYALTISMPKCISFKAALNYIIENMNTEEDLLWFGCTTIVIYSKKNTKRVKLTLKHDNSEDIIGDFEKMTIVVQPNHKRSSSVFIFSII